MTVGELKEIIKYLDNDVRVVTENNDLQIYDVMKFELLTTDVSTTLDNVHVLKPVEGDSFRALMIQVY